MFTINNPGPEDDPKKWEGIKFIVFQLERGENNTNHYQGYVQFISNKRIAALKKINRRAHWEKRRGTHDQAVAYCTKKETRISEPYKWGEEPEKGKRNDLLAVKELIDKGARLEMVADQHFGTFIRYNRGLKLYMNMKSGERTKKTEVTVIYGPTGTGKTRFCADNFPNSYWVYPQSSGSAKWWDGYDNEEVVIIDEFYGWFPHSYMLRLLDRYPMQVESKGGVSKFLAKQILITSNKSPDTWYPKLEAQYPQLERRIDNILIKESLDDDFMIIKGKVPDTQKNIIDSLSPEGITVMDSSVTPAEEREIIEIISGTDDVREIVEIPENDVIHGSVILEYSDDSI